MTKVFKLRKGLNIPMMGGAKEDCQVELGPVTDMALVPASFPGVIPKVVVREGDRVNAGDALFVNKACPEVKFASPVSGTVSAIVRGERRKVLCVKITPDAETAYTDFGKKNVETMDGEAVKQTLLEAGLFGYINQLPYAVSTTPDTKPKAIFVSAIRDMPLSGNFEKELAGNEEAWQAGLTALSKMAKTYLGISKAQTSNKALAEPRNVEVNIFDGPCPAGNVGVQVNHLDPVNKGEVVWTVSPTSVIFFGRLFLTGKVDLRKVIALAGTPLAKTGYMNVLVGTKIMDIVKPQLASLNGVRLISGNPLTGRRVDEYDYLDANASEVCCLTEGSQTSEFLGWIMPRLAQFSASHSYFSWLKKKPSGYEMDTRVKGGQRAMIMSGEYDKVMPMDIYPEYLIKAILAGDIDKQEQLGIYEVSPEDFAVAEFVDSSKMELQKIVREGLDLLRKENA